MAPNYKATGTLFIKSISGTGFAKYSLFGCFITKRVTPDLDMSSEGEMATVDWSFSIDSMIPI